MTIFAELSIVFFIIFQVTGHLMTLTSKSTLRTTKTMYRTNIAPPNGLLIFHFDIAIVAITVMSITNNKKMEQTSPLLFTSTVPPLIAKYINQGIGNPTVISKILLPTELDTAMSPNPFLATITLVMRSGILVPAAIIVKPIISSWIPMVLPTVAAHQSMR